MRAGQLKWAEIGQARSRLMRRLRAGLVTSRPGRLGQPSAPTTWGCLRWLDAVRMNGGGSRRDQGPTGALSAPGSTVPRREIAAGGAPRGVRGLAASRKSARRALRLASVAISIAPFGAPLPRYRGKDAPLKRGYVARGYVVLAIMEYKRTNLGFTRDWLSAFARSAKADLAAPAKENGR